MKYYIVASTVDKKPVIFDIAFTYRGAKKFISNYNRKVDQFVRSDIFKDYWESKRKVESEDFQMVLHRVGISNSMRLTLDQLQKRERKYLHYAETLELILNDKNNPENLIGGYENFIHIVNRPKMIDLSL